MALLIASQFAPTLVWASDAFSFDENFNLRKGCSKLFANLGLPEDTPAPLVFSPEAKEGRFPVSAVPQHRKDALYIGVANTKADGNHHYYLMAGGVRFDGRPLYAAPSASRTGIASNGVLFEIPLPAAELDSLRRRFLDEGTRHITCLHALCRLLEKEGIQIEGADQPKTYRTRIVARSLIEGKVRLKGRELDPKSTRWIATGEDEVTHFLEEAWISDERMESSLKAQGLAIVVLSTIASGTGFVIQFYQQEKKSSP